MSLDLEAVQSASLSLPDEHLQSTEVPKVEQDRPDPPQPAESAPARDATAGEQPPQNTDAQPQEPAKKPGVQKRIDELTRERYEAQRQAEYWRQQAEAVARQQPPQQPKPAPRIEEFQDVNQFLAARDEWVKEQTKAEIVRELTQAQQRSQFEQQQHQQAIQQQQIAQRFIASEEDARSRYQDYDQAVAGPLMQEVKRVRPDVIQAVIDSPHGPDIAYFLAKNPAHATRVAQLPPIAAAREIGRIEQMFMGQKPQVTNAPEPPRQVGNTAPAGRDPARMSVDEYRKWRASGGGR